MSFEHVDSDLRTSFEHYRSRVLQLNRNNLTKSFELLEISRDSTDPEDLKQIYSKEWPVGLRGSPTNGFPAYV